MFLDSKGGEGVQNHGTVKTPIHGSLGALFLPTNPGGGPKTSQSILKKKTSQSPPKGRDRVSAEVCIPKLRKLSLGSPCTIHDDFHRGLLLLVPLSHEVKVKIFQINPK